MVPTNGGANYCVAFLYFLLLLLLPRCSLKKSVRRGDRSTKHSAKSSRSPWKRSVAWKISRSARCLLRSASVSFLFNSPSLTFLYVDPNSLALLSSQNRRAQKIKAFRRTRNGDKAMQIAETVGRLRREGKYQGQVFGPLVLEVRNASVHTCWPCDCVFHIELAIVVALLFVILCCGPSCVASFCVAPFGVACVRFFLFPWDTDTTMLPMPMLFVRPMSWLLAGITSRTTRTSLSKPCPVGCRPRSCSPTQPTNAPFAIAFPSNCAGLSAASQWSRHGAGTMWTFHTWRSTASMRLLQMYVVMSQHVCCTATHAHTHSTRTNASFVAM